MVFEGNREHIGTRDPLNQWYPNEFEFRNGGKKNGGPDFLHRPTGHEVELTTRGEEKAHRNRPGYDKCTFAFWR